MADDKSGFSKSRKVPGSLLTFTYGALVAQLVRDMNGDTEKINTKLDSMGESMGVRMVDEVVAKANIRRCAGVFPEAINMVANIGFKYYWNMVPKVTSWNESQTACSLEFGNETPLEEFVEVPDQLAGLRYSQILCGIIRGGLESVSMRTKVYLVRERVRDDATEIRVELIEVAREMAGEDYQEE